MKIEISERLKALRGSRSQKEVADSIGICESSYASYEAGERIPSDENKSKLARFFGRTVQEIFFN